MALLDILDCTMDDLIEPVAAAGAGGREGRRRAAAGPASAQLRPRRARITGPPR